MILVHPLQLRITYDSVNPMNASEGILYSQFLYRKKKEKKKFSPNLIYLKVVLKLQFATFIEANEIQRRKKQESGAMYISQ